MKGTTNYVLINHQEFIVFVWTRIVSDNVQQSNGDDPKQLRLQEEGFLQRNTNLDYRHDRDRPVPEISDTVYVIFFLFMFTWNI